MRNKTRLEKCLKRLCHGSQEAVQSGDKLTELDSYLHVVRPVEDYVKAKLRTIQAEGGGLLLLVGSAGDGKSHLISRLKSTGEFRDIAFHNDATESCGPGVSAVDTLKYALSEFSDSRIDETNEKLLVAINLGKLLDLIEDADIRSGFTRLVKVGNSLVADRMPDGGWEPARIHVVSLAHQQAFEMSIDENAGEYPFSSKFMSEILEKLVAPVSENPFYNAFKKDTESVSGTDPVLLNYRMLFSQSIRDTLVSLIIEASFRFNLMLTPRDYLDFIYSIIVPKGIAAYSEAHDFFKSCLPNLVFDCCDTKIQRALNRLDPMKVCSLEHDRTLSNLYSTFEYTPELLSGLDGDLNMMFGSMLNQFYQNHLDEKTELCALQFRMQHLLSYHSDCDAFKSFIKDLVGYWNKDTDCWEHIAGMVTAAIPRHYGSYISQNDIIPLNFQGSGYKLFAQLAFPDAIFSPDFDSGNPQLFDPAITMEWPFDKERVPLRLDYVLYEHLFELLSGKLSTSFNNDRNLAFSRFVRKLAGLSAYATEIKVVGKDGKVQTLSNKYTKLQLR